MKFVHACLLSESAAFTFLFWCYRRQLIAYLKKNCGMSRETLSRILFAGPLLLGLKLLVITTAALTHGASQDPITPGSSVIGALPPASPTALSSLSGWLEAGSIVQRQDQSAPTHFHGDQDQASVTSQIKKVEAEISELRSSENEIVEPFAVLEWASELQKLQRIQLLKVEGPSKLQCDAGQQCPEGTFCDFGKCNEKCRQTTSRPGDQIPHQGLGWCDYTPEEIDELFGQVGLYTREEISELFGDAGLPLPALLREQAAESSTLTLSQRKQVLHKLKKLQRIQPRKLEGPNKAHV